MPTSASARANLKKFHATTLNQQGKFLLHLPRRERQDLLTELDYKTVLSVVKHLDHLEASEILTLLPVKQGTKILKHLDKNIRKKVERLLKIKSESAANLISFDYIEVSKSDTISKILSKVDRHEKKTGRLPAVLVVENGLLLGEVSLHRLAAKATKTLEKSIKEIAAVKYNRRGREILEIFKNNPHSKVVVLDDNDSILGVIYSDDIIRVLQQEGSKSLRHFAGVRREENILDGALTKVRYRYLWLILNLFTAFLAAAVVGMFEETISRLVFLAAYLPIVAGMGGNAATQTLAIAVRGLALREITRKNFKKIIFNESLAGLINGLITGAVAAVIALLWNQNPMLGVVIAIAMVTNLFIAGFFGTIIPLMMQKLGKDPAASATILITTATDIFGFLAFLGCAKLLL